MKSFLLTLSLAFVLGACSSSNDDNNNGGLSGFAKASNGDWVSDCLQDSNGNFRDMMNLKGTSGSSTRLSFPGSTCAGNATAGQPRNFTYSAKSKPDGSADVTLTFQGAAPVTVQVSINGDNMTVTGPDGPVRYQRVGGAPGKPGTDNGGNAMAAFDAQARGYWLSKECFRVGDGRGFFKLLNIQGGGRLSLSFNVYNNEQCNGQPTPANGEEITYGVQSWTNGQGSLTLNGQSVQVRIMQDAMFVNGAEGSEAYERVRR